MRLLQIVQNGNDDSQLSQAAAERMFDLQCAAHFQLELGSSNDSALNCDCATQIAWNSPTLHSRVEVLQTEGAKSLQREAIDAP